jgi:DNA-binding transcriptional ArsR family regulator
MSDEIQHGDSTGVFPRHWPVTPQKGRTPRIIEINEDGAADVFNALSSETARTLLDEIHKKPKTASDLAPIVGTSIQNVQYHLQKFENADLVEVVDSWYSSRGLEMKVYAPVDRSLILYTGDHPNEPSLGDRLTRLLGSIGILGIISIIINQLAQGFTQSFTEETGTGGSEPHILPDIALFEIAGNAISPGVMFFIIGLFIFLIIFVSDGLSEVSYRS